MTTIPATDPARRRGLLIFDLDGTLLNTIADLGAACNEALACCGFPTHRPDEYPRLVGNGVNKLLERALPEGAKTEANILRLRRVFIPYYDTHNRVFTRPYEGMPDVLRVLRDRGWLLAVASNKYQQAAADIVAHYFPGLFDVVLGEREGCPRKPDPQIVSDILRLLGLPAPDRATCPVVYVGDSDVDILTARNAGLPVIACTWGFCDTALLRDLAPDYLIDTPQDLLTIPKLQ